MNRWITQAVVFGVAISESAAKPLQPSPGRLSLSSGANSDENYGVLPAVTFRFLDQCAEANLDMDSCLVSNTFLALSEMDAPPSEDEYDDDALPARRRFLQDCGAPEVDDEDLRLAMVNAEAQCAASGTSFSNQEFEDTLFAFLKIFNSESCLQQLCEDDPPRLFIDILFDEVANCAGVDLEINQCLMNQVIETAFNGEDSNMDDDAERVRRKLSDSTSGVSSNCEQPSHHEVEWFVQLMLLGAEAKCSDLGTPVTTQEVANATPALTAIFAAQHCFGNDGCEEIQEYPSNDDNQSEGTGGVSPFVIFEYLNQCSEAMLEGDSCLVSNTLLALSGMDAPPTDADNGVGDSMMPTSSVTPNMMPAVPTGVDDSVGDSMMPTIPTDIHDMPTSSVAPNMTPTVPTEVGDSMMPTILADINDGVGDSMMPTSATTPNLMPTMAPTFPARRRFLQEDCSSPEMNEEDLRQIMATVEAQCAVSGDVFTYQETEDVVNGFLKIFDSESCFQQLCEENSSNPYGLLLHTMLGEAAGCANIDLDTNQCLIDEVFESMFNGGGSGMNGDVERVRQMITGYMDGQDPSSCAQVSYQELRWYISFVLMGAEEKCFVTTQEVANATTDLATIFAAQHCWSSGCEENHESNSHEDHHYDSANPDDGLDYFNITIKYIEQCSGLNLNTTTCLASNTIDIFTAWGAVPSGQSPDDHHRQRFLQGTSEDNGSDECIPPELEEPELRYIIEQSKQQCTSQGHVVSDQEVEQTVGDFVDFFGAQNCWVALCEEDSAPSSMMLRIMFEEIAHCAGAELDFNPCLLDQIFHIVFFSEDSDDAFDGVRRKLEETFGSSQDETTDPCEDQAGDAEIMFGVSLLLAGAKTQCMEMGEVFEVGEVTYAESELFKLFRAQQCWGVSHGCNEDNGEHLHGEHDSSYLEFIEERTTWMLGECADVEEISCVFSRSVEAMGMKRFGMSYDGSLAQPLASICTPPTDDEYNAEQIVTDAMKQCVEDRALGHYDQAVHDLENLIANPDCYENLCEPEVKEMIIEEWMHTCASMDLKFLTAHGPYMAGDASLDSDRLRCMANYISSKNWEDPSAHWACSLPHLGPGVCGSNPTDHAIGREAYSFCGGEVETHPPSRSPSMHPSMHPSKHPSMHPTLDLSLSMSIAYTDEFDWTEYEPDLGFSMSLPLDNDAGFSVTYNDDDGLEHESEVSLYIEVVCSLIGELNADIAKDCLQPVCDIGIEDVFDPDGNNDGESGDLDDDHIDDSMMPTAMPSITSPTMTPSSDPIRESNFQITPTSRRPTQAPQSQTTPLPTLKPTPSPSKQPTPSPTVQQFGSVEVSFEVEVTLDGIDMSDFDITALDEVSRIVDLLESVLGELLPPGAIVRLLKFGGFSVTRRLLRFLEDDVSGVDVEFEVIMTQACSSAKCEDTEAEEISTTLYDDVTSNLKAKVESGELTSTIQEEADASGISELSEVSVSASSLQVSEATVTVKEAQEEGNPTSTPSPTPSTSSRLGLRVALSITAGIMSMIFLLHI